MSGDTDFAALVCARICHDLVSPLSAIGNGIELLGMTDNASGPEMELVEQSVQNATARVRFFRVAFGPVAPGQMISRGEVLSTLAGVAAGGRLKIHWEVDADATRQDVRLAFLALQCIETAMAFGGEVRIGAQAGGFAVMGSAPRLLVDPALWSRLAGPGPGPAPGAGLSASHVQFGLLPARLAEAGRTLDVAIEDTRLTLRF